MERFEKEIEKILQQTKYNQSGQIKIELGEASENLVNIAKKNGFNILNYKHNIDIFGLRHTLKHHGEGKEKNKNQIPINNEDFKNIHNIIYNYDNIVWGFKDSKGTDLIKYIKKLDNFVIYYFEEIRTGKKTLTLKTMYKKAVSLSDLPE